MKGSLGDGLRAWPPAATIALVHRVPQRIEDPKEFAGNILNHCPVRENGLRRQHVGQWVDTRRHWMQSWLVEACRVLLKDFLLPEIEGCCRLQRTMT